MTPTLHCSRDTFKCRTIKAMGAHVRKKHPQLMKRRRKKNNPQKRSKASGRRRRGNPVSLAFPPQPPPEVTAAGFLAASAWQQGWAAGRASAMEG